MDEIVSVSRVMKCVFVKLRVDVEDIDTVVVALAAADSANDVESVKLPLLTLGVVEGVPDTDVEGVTVWE